MLALLGADELKSLTQLTAAPTRWPAVSANITSSGPSALDHPGRPDQCCLPLVLHSGRCGTYVPAEEKWPERKEVRHQRHDIWCVWEAKWR